MEVGAYEFHPGEDGPRQFLISSAEAARLITMSKAIDAASDPSAWTWDPTVPKSVTYYRTVDAFTHALDQALSVNREHLQIPSDSLGKPDQFTLLAEQIHAGFVRFCESHLAQPSDMVSIYMSVRKFLSITHRRFPFASYLYSLPVPLRFQSHGVWTPHSALTTRARFPHAPGDPYAQ